MSAFLPLLKFILITSFKIVQLFLATLMAKCNVLVFSFEVLKLLSLEKHQYYHKDSRDSIAFRHREHCQKLNNRGKLVRIVIRMTYSTFAIFLICVWPNT